MRICQLPIGLYRSTRGVRNNAASMIAKIIIIIITKIREITGNIATLNATGIGLGELAVIESPGKKTLGQVIRIAQDEMGMRVGIVSCPNTIGNGSVCHVARDMAHVYTYGAMTLPLPKTSRCIVIWGKNDRNTAPGAAEAIFHAREQGARLIVIDPVIKASSPQFDFLVLDAEGKKNYLTDLSADIDILYPTDPKKEERKAGLVVRLNAVWNKYPVVSETRPGGAGYPAYGGTETTLRFAPSVTSTRLTDEENAAIRESAAIMKEAFERTHPTQPTPLPSVLVILAIGCTVPVSLLIQKRRRGS